MGVINILKSKIFTLNSKEEKKFFQKELEDMNTEEIIKNIMIIIEEFSISVSDILENLKIKNFNGLHIVTKPLRSKTSKIRILSSVLKPSLNQVVNGNEVINRILFTTEKIDVYLNVLITELKQKNKSDLKNKDLNISLELIQLKNISRSIEEIKYEIESLIKYNVKSNEILQKDYIKYFNIDIYSRRYYYSIEEFFFRFENSKEIYNNCLKSNIKEYTNDEYVFTLIEDEKICVDKILEQVKLEIDTNIGKTKINGKLKNFNFLESLKILDVGYHTEILTMSYEALEIPICKFYIKREESAELIKAINKVKETQIRDENISVYYKKYM